jgi:hypothetical protein
VFSLRLVVVVVVAAVVAVVASFHLGNTRPTIFSCFTPH